MNISMKIRNICIPCALDFAYRTLKFIGYEDDEKILMEIMKELINIDYSLTPAHLGTIISRKIKKLTGIEDPYMDEKRKQNDIGKSIYNVLKMIVRESKNPLIEAIKISCIGNSIDLGATGFVKLDFERIKDELNFELNEKRLNEFLSRLKRAKTVLFVSDNAGEIIFDKVFLEEIKDKKIYVNVKSKPIINDITIKEINETGISEFAEIIETGTDSLGIMFDEVSKDFKRLFHKADIVVAKGHANFETLIDAEREVFFILRAKCDYVAEILGIKKFSYFAGKIREKS